ncbi:MAG: hypothetical protein PWR14_516 [Thermosediminibacterales bacterium]|nr:hypothetical protein [Thermosediminibacterales bacterium]
MESCISIQIFLEFIGGESMKKIVIFDTSSASLNKGDEIIMECTKQELYDITKNSFVVNMPTHTPVFHWYQTAKVNSKVKLLKEADYKFVCGTNLLYTNMLRPWPNWNINIFNSKPIKDCILVGVGCGINSKNINFYTKKLYRSVLSHVYIHSVRDDKAKEILESMGFKAINTGCPTLWALTPELCRQIPTKKSDSVVFTLTDYCKDEKSDQKLINILKNNYEKIYFWPQGAGDFEYLSKFKNTEDIVIIPPTVEDFSKILNTNIDYIGTRLHAGIYAMRHKKRSIIIAVDYRAREMNKSYNLNCIERKKLNDLPNMINSEFITQVNLKRENIEFWLKQFKDIN